MTDEVEDRLLCKALFVSEIPYDFNPNKVPETGEEYIHSVMYEAKRCEEFKCSNINLEKFQQKQTFSTEVMSCMTVPKHLIFSQNWQDRKLAQFSAFRQHIKKLKSKFVPRNNFVFNEGTRNLYILCSKPPKLTDVFSLKQNHLTKTLECYVSWLDNPKASNGLQCSFNAWLYAILTCLEVPLWPDTSSAIRDIIRKISKILSNLSEDAPAEILIPLNLFFCIIIRYFNNLDLLECIE